MAAEAAGQAGRVAAGSQMFTIALLFLLSLPATQSGTALFVRLGPTGDRLTSDDVDQIRRLRPDAKPVWLVVGHPRTFIPSNSWYVEAYLAPDASQTRVRRGQIVWVKAELTSPEAYDSPKRWEFVSTAGYAQVSVEGGGTDAITGPRDLNRPFKVVGTFDDDTLVSIVSFVRSSPSFSPPPSSRPEPPQVPTGIFRQVQGTWPIAAIIGQGESGVELSLLDSSPYEKSGQRVILRRNGNSWVVAHLSAWFAD
jgi:hypothetical protein